ncbi:unnamed protein product [Aphis gossypii]|uniref:RNA-directed DNA polymerase n=1 Tax=Aphis gossypii TaxID=80765 RepID=A0A9P0J1K4_APHGO|nr:unnamed protein product [Aphis gossypii]
MPRKKKNEDLNEEWERRFIEIETQIKEQTKKIEKQKKEIQNIKEEHKEEIQNLKLQWEEIHNKKIQETEEKYQSVIEEMENRYVTTFRNLGDSYQQNTHNKKEEICRGPITDITKPLFFGNRRDMHPIDFLNRLDEYFTLKQITHADEKLIIAGDCLKATASNWFSTIRFQVTNLQEFQDTFKDEYWSRDIQMQTWSQCLSVKQIPNDTNYREHFSYWATKLRHLEVPRLAEQEIVSNIASHYPGYLRAILISLPECTILNAMKILGTEEHRRTTVRENSNSSYENRQPQNRENNNNNQNRTREETPRRESNWRQTGRINQPREYQVTRNNQENNRDTNQQWRDRQAINQISATEDEQRDINNQDQVSHAVNNIQANLGSVSPYLKCVIEGEPIEALIDTGATISVINKELADQIIRTNVEIPVLPISSVQISNAVGRKICKVSKQLFCSCDIGDRQIFINFIQVENLNERAIIGADVLNQYNTHINFTDKTIKWLIRGEQRTTPFSENHSPEKNQITNIEIIEEPAVNVTLNTKEEEVFKQLLQEYQHIFSDNPGLIRDYECQIKVSPGEPVYQRPYPIPISRLSKIDKEIQRMLDLGIIEKSDSPWSSPIIGIEKKNGEIRLCLDARKINKRIIPDRECPMNMEEILLKFQGAKYLSTIDLTSGYWQCQLKKESRAITAFLHRGRNYQFKVLPFGLVNSVAEFQKILDQVLGPEILEFTATYVDDIHITSTTFEEHMHHLRTIFNQFKKHNVTVNIHKSQFLQKKIIFLGHVISEEGISMDPEKIKTIQEFPAPRNQKQIRAFLGFINFYRKYIRDLSSYTEKLSQLTKKNQVWTWSQEHQVVFDKIKQCFLEDIIIKYPNFTEPFYMATDASSTHIGAELYQIDKDGQHRTIGFTSRTLQEVERRYYTTERELLAIVFGCKKYRNYILGHTTYLLTDHQALTFLNTCRLLNTRLMRWAIQIQEFNLNIQFVAGKNNVGADTLTRYVQAVENKVPTHQQIFINQLIVDQYSKEFIQKLQQLPKLQQEDKKIQRIIYRLHENPQIPYTIHQQLLFYIDKQGKSRLMIPDQLAVALIKETHERYGHSGATKIYQILKSDCQLSHMYKTIKRITQSCDICQKSKIFNQLARGPMKTNIPTEPREMVSLDLIGPLPTGQLGAKYILVMMDVFSKYIQVYPLRKAKAETILNKIEKQYIPQCGIFQKILTDNGTQFHSRAWAKGMAKLGVKIIRTTTYNPEGNPVERANREIGRILRTYCHKKHTNWVNYLKKIEFWINNTTHTTTGYTPRELMGIPKQTLTLGALINFPTNIPEVETKIMIKTARARMKKVSQQRNQNMDQGKKFIKYQVNQQVLVREHRLSSAEDKEIRKLFLLYRGPYYIKEVRENNTIVVQEGQNMVTYNVRNVRPYKQ